MSFDCSGNTIFTDLELDYSDDNVLLATITADAEWKNNTQASLSATMGDVKVLEEKFELCTYLIEESVACGDAGNVTLDLSSIAVPSAGATSETMASLISSSYIEFKAKPSGKNKEKCIKSPISTTSHLFSFSHSPITSENAFKFEILFGIIALVALVGLAAFAYKRSKISVGILRVKRIPNGIRITRSRSGRSLSRSRSGRSRSRSRSSGRSITRTTSSKSLEQKLYEGEEGSGQAKQAEILFIFF
eukprot:scaffold12362_cov79-Skeletonema_dohrnii-CCMP3373.AAC.2